MSAGEQPGEQVERMLDGRRPDLDAGTVGGARHLSRRLDAASVRPDRPGEVAARLDLIRDDLKLIGARSESHAKRQLMVVADDGAGGPCVRRRGAKCGVALVLDGEDGTIWTDEAHRDRVRLGD